MHDDAASSRQATVDAIYRAGSRRVFATRTRLPADFDPADP
jgi:hypothetical protein